MNTPTIPALVLPFLVAILVSNGQPSAAAEHLVGGYTESPMTNAEVIASARFAVKAQSAAPEQKAAVTLVEILSAQQQVVAGMNDRLRLKVKVEGKDREAEAVAWWQAWRKPDPYRLTSWTWKQYLPQTDTSCFRLTHP